MVDSPPETPWQEILKFCGGARNIAWVVGIVIAAILYLFSLPLLVVGIVGGGSFVLLALGMYGWVSASSRRSIESLGEQMRLAPPEPFDPAQAQAKPSHASQLLPTVTAAEESIATATPPEPGFECENDTRVVIYGIDWDTKTIVREAPTREELADPQANITFVWAVLARFYFQQNNRVDHTLYLSAHIWFYSPENEFLKRVIDGIWDGNPLKRSTHIQQGRALELMVVLVPIAEPNGTAGFLYSAEFADENHPSPYGDNYVVTPSLEMVAVKEKEFLLKVELLPKKTTKETFPLQPFWFKLALEPEIKLTRTASPSAEQFPQTPNVLS